jgi:protein-disulfide isomerase
MTNSHHSTDLAVPVTEIDHVLGAKHAPITIVEYGDFECPTCKQAASTVKLLLEQFAGRIRVAYRHFPLEAEHPHALHAAEAAEAAGAQGKFWQMHDLLFEHQSHLNLRRLHSYAEQLQLDMVRFTAEMNDEIYLQRIREHIDGAKRSHVRSEPAFFINGIIHDVSFGLHTLVDGVEAALRG